MCSEGVGVGVLRTEARVENGCVPLLKYFAWRSLPRDIFSRHRSVTFVVGVVYLSINNDIHVNRVFTLRASCGSRGLGCGSSLFHFEHMANIAIL